LSIFVSDHDFVKNCPSSLIARPAGGLPHVPVPKDD
jgi:hypothetical protein